MRTSSKGAINRRQRGITLVEMVVVIIILAIMASLLERNFSRIKEDQDERAFLGGLQSEVSKAKVAAITDGKTVTLEYDSAQGQITLNESSTDTSDPTQFVTLAEQQNQTTQPIQTLTVPSGVSLANFRIGTNDASSGDWKVRFFPEGRSEGGGVEVTSGQQTRALLIDLHGNATYVNGSLPDTSNDVWQAGNLETRTG